MSLSPASPLLRQLACARCGAAFECGAAAGKCWCAEENYPLPVPAANSGEDCLCPACLRKVAAAGVIIRDGG
jgi:hypothetical protein